MPEPRTLVFGATGSLGGHLLTELVARAMSSEAITAVGRNTEGLAERAAVGLKKGIATGTFARVGGDLTRLIGRPTTGVVDGLTAE